MMGNDPFPDPDHPLITRSFADLDFDFDPDPLFLTRTRFGSPINDRYHAHHCI